MAQIHYYYTLTKDNMCYVGRTKDPKARLATHRCRVRDSNYKLYQEMRKNGGIDAFTFTIVDTRVYEDPFDARQRERELTQELNANLNTCTPNNRPDNVSYYQRHKDTLRVKARERYQKTKTEWKHPPRTPAQTKKIHMAKIARTGVRPTQLTCEKYEITPDEIETAIRKHQAK